MVLNIGRPSSAKRVDSRGWGKVLRLEKQSGYAPIGIGRHCVTRTTETAPNSWHMKSFAKCVCLPPKVHRRGQEGAGRKNHRHLCAKPHPEVLRGGHI